MTFRGSDLTVQPQCWQREFKTVGALQFRRRFLIGLLVFNALKSWVSNGTHFSTATREQKRD
jgi:hypothetical protein